MNTDALAALTRSLGRPAAELPAVTALTPADQQRLAQLVDDAFARQDEAIQTNMQKSLNLLPRLLRNRVAKLLFPEVARERD